jgi:hypothetical protein
VKEKKVLRRRESNPDLLGSNDLKANDAKPLHHVEQPLVKLASNQYINKFFPQFSASGSARN